MKFLAKWEPFQKLFQGEKKTSSMIQGWEFAHLLIAHLLILLNQMRDCEWFAQIAQDKWATVSESLRSLKTDERFAQVAHDKWANEPFAQKMLAKQI